MIGQSNQPSLYRVLEKAQPRWSTADLCKVYGKLQKVNVTDVESLGQAIMEGYLNSQLGALGERRLKPSTLAQLKIQVRDTYRASQIAREIHDVSVARRCFCDECLHGFVKPASTCDAVVAAQTGGPQGVTVQTGSAPASSSTSSPQRSRSSSQIAVGTPQSLRQAGANIVAVKQRHGQPSNTASERLRKVQSDPYLVRKVRVDDSLTDSNDVLGFGQSKTRACGFPRSASSTDCGSQAAVKTRKDGPLHLPEVPGGMRRNDDALEALLQLAECQLKRGYVKPLAKQPIVWTPVPKASTHDGAVNGMQAELKLAEDKVEQDMRRCRDEVAREIQRREAEQQLNRHVERQKETSLRQQALWEEARRKAEEEASKAADRARSSADEAASTTANLNRCHRDNDGYLTKDDDLKRSPEMQSEIDELLEAQEDVRYDDGHEDENDESDTKVDAYEVEQDQMQSKSSGYTTGSNYYSDDTYSYSSPRTIDRSTIGSLMATKDCGGPPRMLGPFASDVPESTKEGSQASDSSSSMSTPSSAAAPSLRSNPDKAAGQLDMYESCPDYGGINVEHGKTNTDSYDSSAVHSTSLEPEALASVASSGRSIPRRPRRDEGVLPSQTDDQAAARAIRRHRWISAYDVGNSILKGGSRSRSSSRSGASSVLTTGRSAEPGRPRPLQS